MQELWRQNKRLFKGYVLASGLALLPIILFVPRYIDDYRRGIEGYFRWTKQSFRPLADGMYFLFNLGAPATALAPLGQLLSLLVAAVAAVALRGAFQIRNTWLAVLATLPLLINPYFLENFSYGFDCLSMTTAVALAVFAASQTHRAWSWGHWGAICAALLGVLLLYQPALGAYLPIALSLWIWRRLDHHLRQTATPDAPSLRGLFVIIAAPLTSLVILKLLTSILWRQRSSYARSAGELREFSGLAEGVWGSVSSYLKSLWQHWSGTPFSLIFLVLVITYVVILSRRLIRQQFHAAFAVFLAVALAAILIVIAPGAMYLLKIDFMASPRMNAYLGGLICSLTLPIASEASGLEGGRLLRQRIARIFLTGLLLVWTWCQIVFSYAYGHAMQAQREYEQGRLARLIGAIALIDPGQQARYIHFEGSMPASPLLVNTSRKFPLMDALVPRMINGAWSWGAKQLWWYGFKLLPDDKKPASAAAIEKAKNCGQGPYQMCTKEHNLLLDGQHIIVQMK